MVVQNEDEMRGTIDGRNCGRLAGNDTCVRESAGIFPPFAAHTRISGANWTGWLPIRRAPQLKQIAGAHGRTGRRHRDQTVGDGSSGDIGALERKAIVGLASQVDQRLWKRSQTDSELVAVATAAVVQGRKDPRWRNDRRSGWLAKKESGDSPYCPSCRSLVGENAGQQIGRGEKRKEGTLRPSARPHPYHPYRNRAGGRS